MLSATRIGRIFDNHSHHQFGLPLTSHDASELIVSQDYLRELSYDVEQLSKSVHHNVTKLNLEQSHVHYEVIRSINSNSGRVFFLDGTEKTF